MKYTNKTEYGLICMIYMARSKKNRVSIKELTLNEKYPTAYLEKILQALRHAGLVLSQPGKRGGYALAKRPSEITLKDIIEAIEGETFETFCEPAVREEIVCSHFCLCGIRPIWIKAKQLLDGFFESLTLEMMTSDATSTMKFLPKAV
jgi:Rrf2 family protein